MNRCIILDMVHTVDGHAGHGMGEVGVCSSLACEGTEVEREVMEGPWLYRYKIGWMERTIKCALWCFSDNTYCCVVTGGWPSRSPIISLGHRPRLSALVL